VSNKANFDKYIVSNQVILINTLCQTRFRKGIHLAREPLGRLLESLRENQLSGGGQLYEGGQLSSGSQLGSF